MILSSRLVWFHVRTAVRALRGQKREAKGTERVEHPWEFTYRYVRVVKQGTGGRLCLAVLLPTEMLTNISEMHRTMDPDASISIDSTYVETALRRGHGHRDGGGGRERGGLLCKVG